MKREAIRRFTESIIVGEVPETFTDVGEDMDMLDLVP